MQSYFSSCLLHPVSYAGLEIETQNLSSMWGPIVRMPSKITPWDPRKRVCTNMLPFWRYVDGLDVVLYVCTNCGAYA